MSYTVLARRYRSGTFDEVIGQDHVARTLKKAIASGRIAHAYLFCGTRGTGKTSTARILAKCLNCEKSDGPAAEPCNQCESCRAVARGEDMDVIEIDAASNTGVDNVRDIIENAQYRPARSRFKVYIIDEVHMLSKAAFNALLKTMEEPPGHVKFILATTEPEKVLPTILSRCQRYDFRNIPTREIAGHLKEICQKEKVKADDAAILLVAKAGAGSMRDALSLLDRLLSVGENELTVGMIEQLLGLPRSQLLFDLAEAMGSGDVKSTLSQADSIVQGGLSADGLVAALVDHLRNLLILRTCGKDCELVEVPGLSIDDLAAQAEKFDPVVLTQDITVLEELRRHMRQSQAGRALLDATLVRMALADQFASIGELLSRLDGGGDGNTAGRPAARPVGAGRAPQLPVRSPAQATGTRPAPAPAQAPAPDQKKNASEAAAVDGAGATRPAVGPPTAPARPAFSGDIAAPIAVAPAPSAPASAAPPAPTVHVDFGEDDDDSLPQPGRVWDAGPKLSLGEIMKQHAARTAAAGAPPADDPAGAPPPADAAARSPDANVEAVNAADLPAIWKALLALLAQGGPGVTSLLQHAQFVGVEDGQAVIRYGAGNETFVKMLERSGKKDKVRDALTRVLNQNVGVRFVVDAENPAGVAAPRPGAPAPAPAGGVAPADAPAPPPPAAPAGVRITPELVESLRNSQPLVKALMDELGAQVIKVE